MAVCSHANVTAVAVKQGWRVQVPQLVVTW